MSATRINLTKTEIKSNCVENNPLSDILIQLCPNENLKIKNSEVNIEYLLPTEKHTNVSEYSYMETIDLNNAYCTHKILQCYENHFSYFMQNDYVTRLTVRIH